MLDLTTTELADEHCGGVLSAGPVRLTSAGKFGIPQVVSLGALDMVSILGLCCIGVCAETFSATSVHGPLCPRGISREDCTSITL